MKPVAQTITEAGKGNCLAACLASILEVPIEDIPDLKCGGDFAAMVGFLGPRGLYPVWVHSDAIGSAYVGYGPVSCVLCGKSPRLEGRNHAVVARPSGYGFEVVHDPHPEGGGLAGEPVSVIFLVPLKPEAA